MPEDRNYTSILPSPEAISNTTGGPEDPSYILPVWTVGCGESPSNRALIFGRAVAGCSGTKIQGSSLGVI